MRQLVELNKNIDRFTAANTTIVAISADIPAKTAALASRLRPNFSLVSDPDEVISRRYAANIKGAALYFIRPDGTIHYGYTDPPNTLDRPPLQMVVDLAIEAASPESTPRKSEFDAPCQPSRGVWVCEAASP